MTTTTNGAQLREATQEIGRIGEVLWDDAEGAGAMVSGLAAHLCRNSVCPAEREIVETTLYLAHEAGAERGMWNAHRAGGGY